VPIEVISPPPTRPLRLLARELACRLALPVQRARLSAARTS
jgi:hypothetical protein